MARLPKPGGDTGSWGQILNEYLSVEHDENGALRQNGSLAAKANTSDLGTAAYENTESFATAGQGEKADTAVQPSEELTEAVAQRHAHENKAALDGVTSDTLLPAGGEVHQVITKTSGANYAANWQDIPGIVYPSLLLSPDGSYDRDGEVNLSFPAGIDVVPGHYGNAWHRGAGGNSLSVKREISPIGTIIMRTMIVENQGQNIIIFGGSSTNAISAARFGYHAPYLWMLFGSGGSTHYQATAPVVPHGTPITVAISWGMNEAGLYYRWSSFGTDTWSIPPSPFTTDGDRFLRLFLSENTFIESVITYDHHLPVGEITRLSDMPTAWTMENTAANLYQPVSSLALFTPNKKIAAGGTTLRVAPGAATQSVTTLNAGLLIEDSRRTATSSEVSYSLINTTTAGTGWVPTTTLENI